VEKNFLKKKGPKIFEKINKFGNKKNKAMAAVRSIHL
jgi:hypothetical protein